MKFNEIAGKTITRIDRDDDRGDERVVFHFDDGTAAESVHLQDCCESVAVDHVEGDIANIIGRPIIEAEETEEHEGEPKQDLYSWTWTRQRIRTEAGEVTFVWLGESNGYYGETPYFQITHGDKI